MASAKLLPAYLVVGPDEVKRTAAQDRLKARLEASGLAAFNLDERDMTKPQEPETRSSPRSAPIPWARTSASSS